VTASPVSRFCIRTPTETARSQVRLVNPHATGTEPKRNRLRFQSG
jgi:hypothetical protein